MRALTLSHFLRESGFRVHVLSTTGAFVGYHGDDDLILARDTHYLKHPRRVSYERSLESGASPSPKEIKQKFLEALAIPDREIRVVPGLLRKVLHLIRTQRIGHLITTTPPHSSQLVGLITKGLLGARLNWIVDYRDSWNSNPSYGKKTRFGKTLSRWMERSVLSRCDHFTYVSPPMLEKLKVRSIPGLERKSSLVMNGYWNLPPRRQKIGSPDRRAVRIGYFGRLDPHLRSLRNLKHALQQSQALDLEFHFFSDYPDAEHPAFLVHHSQPSREALQSMTGMDLLLLVHGNPESSDEVLTGKLFEYVAARRPILVLGPRDLEARRFVQRHAIGLFADIEDIADIVRVLNSLKELDWSSFEENFQALDIERFSRRRQYEAFLRLLEVGPSDR